MKVHRWNYNYCLFVAYLANVAIGYGWTSDTKFQKVSDKDWIWICKSFFGYGSGVKKSISAHLYCTIIYLVSSEATLQPSLPRLQAGCCNLSGGVALIV